MVVGAPLREDPGAEHDEAQQRGDHARRDQHGQLDGVTRRGVVAAQQEQAAADGKPEREDDEALRSDAQAAARAMHAEGQAPVRRRVGDRGQQQRERIGGLRRQCRAKHQVEHGVGERAGHADQAEAHELPDQPPTAAIGAPEAGGPGAGGGDHSLGRGAGFGVESDVESGAGGSAGTAGEAA